MMFTNIDFYEWFQLGLSSIFSKFILQIFDDFL